MIANKQQMIATIALRRQQSSITVLANIAAMPNNCLQGKGYSPLPQQSTICLHDNKTTNSVDDHVGAVLPAFHDISNSLLQHRPRRLLQPIVHGFPELI
mgnify:FL=1